MKRQIWVEISKRMTIRVPMDLIEVSNTNISYRYQRQQSHLLLNFRTPNWERMRLS